jgi:poly(hydroxyalkanoate) granule-associated protein
MAVKAHKRAVELKLVPKVENRMRELEKDIEHLVEQIAEVTGKVVYFGLGAAVLLREGVEEFFDKAVQKGQESEKDVKKTLKALLTLERKAKMTEETFEERIEAGVRKVMDALDIPSKSDVEKLSKRVAELSNRVSKLTQAQK